MSQFRLPIVAILTFGSAGMTFAAVALALYFGFSSAIENTRGLFYQQAEQVIDGLIKDIGHEIDPVKLHAERLARRVLSGELDPEDEEQWAAVVGELPVTLPQVTSTAFIGSDLQARLYGALGEPVAYRDFAMFPRATRLLERARTVRTVSLLKPLWSPILNKVIVVISVPLYVQDRLIGIHVAVIGLKDLSARIAAAFEGKHTPFVIYDNNWLLVHPSISGWMPSSESIAADMTFAGSTDAALLPDLESLEGQKIGFFWQAKKVHILDDELERDTRVSIFIKDDEKEFFVYRTVSGFDAGNWIVGAHFDGNLLPPEILRLREYGIYSVAVLLLAVVAAAVIGGLTGRPIRRLAAAARVAHSGDLDAVPVLAPSVIRELDDADRSFNEMIAGLKERARIRDLFGKYLPESVASQLLSEHAELTAQSAVATVLFVDLEKFTALSEKLKPQEVADLLNAYFSTVVEIIERHKGVITQFQGDAILAIFNIPVSDPDHAGNAVAAAREMLAAVSGRTFDGHRLAIRVGINTGEVFAGNVGASGRLNYTVHGDAVNTAARLEAMNKELGTRILIGGATTEQLTDVALRRIPDVTIRGKADTVAVYQLLDT